ncbi:hypothetical protein MMC24_001143 [Lignoscripta atroalba]|nr:hypothetical protein [Lignoscripta atroalba]
MDSNPRPKSSEYTILESTTTLDSTSSPDVPTAGQGPPSTVFHIHIDKHYNLTITLAEQPTPLYFVSRCSIFKLEAPTLVHAVDKGGPTVAEITSHSSFSKGKSKIEINFAAVKDRDAYALEIHRDGNALVRRHKIQLSNGRTYTLRGRKSSSILLCNGDLSLVDDTTEQTVADFDAKWLTSMKRFGDVTIFGEHDRVLVEEMLMVVLGLAQKEYRKGMQTMWANGGGY